MDVLWVTLIVLVVVAEEVWDAKRSAASVRAWARRSGYDRIELRYAWAYQGPFFWTTGRGQIVYRVTVREANGYVRRGWVRCGTWWGALLSDRVDVRWDR